MTTSVANYYSQTNPNYRRFELPWSRVEEEAARLRKIVLIVMGVLFVLSLIIPFLPVADIEHNSAADIPPRLAKLVIEKKKLPPPPPPVVEPIKEVPKPKEAVAAEPPKPKPKPKPRVIPTPIEPPKVVKVVPPPVVTPEPTREKIIEQAREKAKTVGLLAVADDLASLRQNSAVANTSGRNLSSAVETSKRTERALITSKSGKRSAGVNTAALSRNTGGGGLAGRATTSVATPVAMTARPVSASASTGSAGVSGSYAGQRSQEEIETVFDQNKAAIYALYRRALRADPTLQGKLVLELTIAASGKVVSCAIVSSELSAGDFEQNLVRRVKMFDFGAQDVDEITTTKPIDFFPA